MKTLVFLEHHEGEIQKGSLALLSRAAELGGDVAGVLVGADVQAAAERAGRYGANTVYVASDAGLAAALPQPRVDVLAQIIVGQSFDNVLFAQSVLASDIAAGLAARLEAGLNWDLIELEERDGELVGTRAALGDSVSVEVRWKGTPRLAIIRAGSFEAVESERSAQVESVDFELMSFSKRATIVESAPVDESGPSIEEAQVIVAGGRGLGAPEGFRLAEQLALALGGAVGATRAVVDAGWYPFATQVGQTGKTVAPKLYLALGISGAIQHKVGMQTSGTIVSINKDPNAPIFEFSDLGVVGDLHTIVPALTKLIVER